MNAIANKLMIVAMLMVGMVAAASAQDPMMKSDKMADPMMSKRPIVAIVRADWCPACKKLEPVMKEIAESYGEKVEFVILDITNEKTKAEAKMTAERYGISKFFDENKEKSSTVAIFKNKKKLFKTHYNSDAKIFTSEIDKALGS